MQRVTVWDMSLYSVGHGNVSTNYPSISFKLASSVWRWTWVRECACRLDDLTVTTHLEVKMALLRDFRLTALFDGLMSSTTSSEEPSEDPLFIRTLMKVPQVLMECAKHKLLSHLRMVCKQAYSAATAEFTSMTVNLAGSRNSGLSHPTDLQTLGRVLQKCRMRRLTVVVHTARFGKLSCPQTITRRWMNLRHWWIHQYIFNCLYLLRSETNKSMRNVHKTYTCVWRANLTMFLKAS